MESSACVFKGRDILPCYVENLLIIGKSKKNIDELKLKFASKLPANDTGEVTD